MLYFICTTGTMVPRVPDTFSCPSKSSRIFIKSFLFLFISSYYGRSSVKVPLSHFSAPRLAHFLVPELLHIILVGSRT